MRKNIDMVHGPLYGGILRFTIPIILTSVLQLLFNAADLVIVGRYCGSISVGAVSATGAITSLIVTLFTGLSVGAGVAVAHGLGGKQDNDVHKTVHTALPTALVGGAILTIVGVLLAEDLLVLMKTPENVLPLSSVYMRIYFSGMIFTMVFNFCASILRAAGDSKSPLKYLSIAGVMNVALNVIFVTVFGMNVDGVALATILSQCYSAAMVVIALMRRTDACKLMFSKLRFHKNQLLKMIRIGLPAGIQGSLFGISNVIIQSSINSFNSDAIMSGNGAAGNIEGFVFVIMDSFHQSAINFIGQNAGAHRFDRVKKIFRISLGYVAIFGAVFGFLAWFFGESLLSIYITDSTDAIAYGVTRLTYVSLPYFLWGILSVTTGALRGLGCSLTPMVISVLGVCGLRILWIYTVFQIPQFHTLSCLYLSYPISWVITFLVEFVAFIILFRRKLRADRLSLNQT